MTDRIDTESAAGGSGGTAVPGRFRLGYVPGATPAKWARIWGLRVPDLPLDLVPVAPGDAPAALRERAVDIAILRLPIDRAGLAVIPLYEEVPVVVMSRDHDLTALGSDEPVAAGDLADVVVLHPLDDVLAWPNGLPGRPAEARPDTTRDAIELVAAGVGVVVVPQSLARLHHRRDVTYRRFDDGPTAPVALAWMREFGTAEVEYFVGIVRGRTANSSRGSGPPAAPGEGAATGSGAGVTEGAGVTGGAAAAGRAGSGQGAPRGKGRKPAAGAPRRRGGGRGKGRRR